MLAIKQTASESMSNDHFSDTAPDDSVFVNT